MCWTFVHLLILTTLSCLSCTAVNKVMVPVSCPDYQRAFGGSCYEFVNLQHSFFSAQAWCEQRGGHLAFIPDEETQYFLQRLSDPEKDVWLGLAPYATPNVQYSATLKGALSWLDGSHITYSNWVSSPQPGAACGHTLRHSGFQWEATRDCNKKLHFICQFDSGRSIVCAGRNTSLQCGSGQVLMIDGGFYGRKNIHYCRSTLSPPTTSIGHQCSWVDAVESLTAHCHGRQVCQIAEVVDSFVEPCPQLGSYLSVDHHCKDGLSLSVSTVAAVLDNVTISVRWLLRVPQGKPSCKMSTGDGRVIYLHSLEGLESSEVHKYTHPSTFVVGVECTSSGIHITAQSTITIQERITVFGVVRCYAGERSFHANSCKTLYREPFLIQMVVKAGTHVTYRIQSDETLLLGLSVFRGNVPKNITVTSETMTQLGPGCHWLTLCASNMVTYHKVCTDLQMCVLEKVAGLQASVLTEGDDGLPSPDITVGVSLERGAPVLLLFSLTGDNSSHYETREMNTSKDLFHIANPIQGPVHVKLRAWNVFSSLEVEVDMFAFCDKDSATKLNGHADLRLRKKHIRVARHSDSVGIIATPSNSVATKNQTITLSLSDDSKLDDPKKQYVWTCKDPCICQGPFVGLTYTINQSCLPDPFHFNKYYFNVIKKDNKKVEKEESICITVTPEKILPISITCTQGCNPIKKDTAATIKMDCVEPTLCEQIVWNIEDSRKDKDWPKDDAKDCYKKAKTRPLIWKQNGGTNYTVDYDTLKHAKDEDNNVIVVITSVDVVPLYKKYTILTSSSTNGDDTATTTLPALTLPGTNSGTTTTPTTPTTAGPASTSPGSSDANTTPNTAGPASTSPGTSDTSTTPTTAGPATTSPGTSDTNTTSTTAGPATTSPGTSDTNTTPTTAGPASTSPGTSDTNTTPTTAGPATTSPGTSDTNTTPTTAGPATTSPGTSDTNTTPTTAGPASTSPGTSDTNTTPTTAGPATASPGTSDTNTTPTTAGPATASPGTSDTNTTPTTAGPASTSPGTSDTTTTPTTAGPATTSPGTSDINTTPTTAGPATASPGTSDINTTPTTAGPATASPGTSDINTTPTTAGSASTSPGTSDTTTTPTTAGPSSTSPGTSDTTTTPTTAGPATASPGSSDTNTTPTTTGPASTSPGTSYTTTTPTTAGPATASPGTSDTTTTPTTAGPTSTSPGTSDTTTTPTTAGPATASPGSSDTNTTPTTDGPASTSPGASDTTTTPTTAITSDASPPATSNNFDNLKWSISPQSGTILDVFTITCKTEVPCSNCQYCFKTDKGSHLRCSNTNEVKSVFLPLGDSSSNYNLIIIATAKNNSFVSSTTIRAKVLDSTATSNSLVADAQASVENAVARLKKQGLLSGETVAQLINSVSNKLNSQSDESNKADRQKFREKMLNIMIDAVKKDPADTPEEVQVIARALAAVVQKGTELSSSAQEEASILFANLSSYLLHMGVNKNEDNTNEVHIAASAIVEGASNILDYSSNKNVSDALLLSLSNTQSALLAFKEVNKAPTIIQQAHICVFVNRVTPGSLHTKTINIPNSFSPTFSLPTLPSSILPSDEPVDIRMLCLNKNPFSWNERGNISGPIGALSLSRKDGASIPVENLSEDIKILIPRPVGEQMNASFLDLGNYSTTVINIPSGNTTLVLKIVPSKDPLPFKLFLGHMDYPTETNNVAMTEMPHRGATQEERYTWLLDPKELKGNNGVHYLVVRPIVGPGIKSINATLSITSFTAACKFWDESVLEWSTFGCRVGVQTTRLVTQCLCNHLTFFGGSFFVTPNLVDASRTAELFGTFAENPVVVCFVGSLFVAYLLVVVWARRKDIQDTAKVKVTVLEDNDPLDEYRYLLSVSTGHRRGASTSSQVTITLLGAEGTSEPHHLANLKKCVFERGAVDVFLLTTPFSMGDLQGIRLWHNNSGSHPAWYVGNVMVHDIQTEEKWHFLCNSWLAIDIGDCSLDKVVPVSTEMDLKRFSNLFFMKTTKDFSDGHLWYSVISRPPSSTFTCVQRVSCCFTLLLSTMLTSIMFYGIPTDPSEQTMDLGHFEFTWQQFMVGVQSSLIMFPINILIVSIFRNSRPRETSCCKRKTKKPDALEQTSLSQTTTTTNVNVTLDTVIKDITRIANSLSKTMKSNIPCTECEFGTGQQVDINAVLSVVEDFIKPNNKTIDAAQPKALPEGSPGSTVEGIQKKSNKSRYLYQQLCHIDKELRLLGPSGFPTPHSYSRALQQIQGIKGFLEDQLFTASCVKPDELTQKKSSPADSTEGSQKKKGCCHGGLPWWFVFVGWLLVTASSFIAGYYTMLYGLKFGKQRSVSWLVSMIISFFQSVLVIQPLKVLCLAVFFALVIKKVDEDDFQNMEFEGNLGDCKGQQMVTRDHSLYEPPPAADIEEMRRKQIMEQKAFALLKEILTYMGFMWMLLLVAYGQRDPNAFFLNRHIRDSFTGKTSHTMSLRDVFTWANTSLLSNLFGVRQGYITDGNSKLVGKARLRQLRVLRNSCQIAGPMLQLAPDCNAPYSWEVEDMGSYATRWNHSVRDNTSTSTSSPWTYQTQSQLRAYPIWGKMVLYRGGGYVAELGPDLQNASSTLENLFRNTWLDVYTRAVFVEFTVYNANVNLFCIVTLLLETTAVGAFQFHSELRSVRLYQSTGGLHIFVMAAEIIYLLFILYYMFLQGKLMKQQRWAYFRSKWNLLELTIILLSWSAVAVFVKRTLLGNRDMTYYQNHKDQFASFYETATADSVLQYLIAFLVLLATFKLWHLLRLNPKMNMITAALQRAWNDISTFLVVIVIMLVAYSVTSNVIYGWKMSSYRTLTDALLTIISMQIGIFNYQEVLDDTPVLGGLLFGSCVVLMTFVVLNLFLSVILVAFHQEQIHHKPSDEEEIVDLMLKNICSLFGIRHKDTKDTRGPDVNKDDGLTLNKSRNTP